MSDFSLDLNEDQLQLQKWVHDFAEGVMRPAAHEWDETRGDAMADHRGGREDRSVLVRFPRQRLHGSDGTVAAARLRGVELG